MSDNRPRCPDACRVELDADDDDVADFLARYRDACAQAGAVPLPVDDLAVLAQAMLTGSIPALVTLH